MQPFRQSQADIRVSEVLELAAELTSMKPEFHDDIFGSAKDASVDMKELVLSGHSFGGITALLSAVKLGEACKACLTMDPWLFAYWQDFKEGKLIVKCPVQIISSEHFHPHNVKFFDSWGTLKAILNHATKQSHQENVVINKIGHHIQVD